MIEEKKPVTLEDIAKLTSSSAELMDVFNRTAIAMLNATAEDHLPLEGNDLETMLEALRLHVEGLQDVESELFMDGSNRK